MLILKGLLAGLFNTACFAILLLAPAGLMTGGTWYWPRALGLVAVHCVLLQASVVALAVYAPASLKARLRGLGSGKQPPADRIVTAILVLTICAWTVLVPFDVFRLRLFPAPPFAASVCGAVLSLLGFGISMMAIYQNSFAAPFVEDQTERGQVVVDTGLYALVRHPLYLGLWPLLAGIALWLESYAALVATVAVIAVLGARILVEEETLRRTLRGYPEYMRKVRYRVVPFVW